MANKTLSKIFKDPSSPGGFSGVNELYREAKKTLPSITKKQVKEFLESNLTYTRNKPRRLRFKRQRTIAAGYMSDVQCDLGDLQKLAKHNKSYRYLLVGIDVLSRRVFLSAVKSKTSEAMKKGFEELFRQMVMLPYRIFTDRGTEFTSKEMHRFFAAKNVQIHHSAFSDVKASMAERAIRNVKNRLYRYFGEYRTLRWIDVISNIANAINHSVCRVTGVRPIDVNFKNAQKIWKHVYGDLWARENLPPAAYRPKDYVRLARDKEVFRKGYLPTFGDELYKVKEVMHGNPNLYEIKTSDGKSKGMYYKEELSRVRRNSVYFIENVVKKRTRDGVKELYVKLYKKSKPVWVREDSLEK
jgi:hypothetical protein